MDGTANDRENLNCVRGSVLPTLSVGAGAAAAAEEEAGCGRRLSCSERGASFTVPNSPMSSARMVIIGLLLHVLSQGKRRFFCFKLTIFFSFFDQAVVFIFGLYDILKMFHLLEPQTSIIVPSHIPVSPCGNASPSQIRMRSLDSTSD